MLAFGMGSAIVFLAFVFLGTLSARGIRSASDYTLAGRRAGSLEVSGILLGALVGGASTVGTVEMAYRWGFSAWWFTLGGGIGCLILGLWFARPLRRTGLATIPEFLAMEYGKGTGIVALAASTLGTFVSVVAQFLAGLAMIQGIWPISREAAAVVVALAVLGFILLGGLKSYGVLGKAKIAFLYLVLAACAAATTLEGRSLPPLWESLPFHPWFNLFGRGLGVDLNAGVSLVVGVMTTQIYIQAVFSASSEETARKGALLSAFLMPPLGLFAIWVGLGMRVRQPGLVASQVLPKFLAEHFHPFVAGALWSGIAITIIGTAAGLCLGIATNLVRDLPSVFRPQKPKDGGLLLTHRMTLLVLVVLAAFLALFTPGSLILSWSYLSMGLRGAGTFLPFSLALLAPKRLSPGWAFLSSFSGLAFTLAWPLTHLPGNPLSWGLFISALCCLLGWKRKGAALGEPPLR
ncbi:MAG: sodium:solute symporter family protein [Synergistaceae bacterium]|jgi:SSS family solute:Na+ symporter|nr:sodium:solute symporter family protein [Synergistaceae bacterium]